MTTCEGSSQTPPVLHLNSPAGRKGGVLTSCAAWLLLSAVLALPVWTLRLCRLAGRLWSARTCMLVHVRVLIRMTPPSFHLLFLSPLQSLDDLTELPLFPRGLGRPQLLQLTNGGGGRGYDETDQQEAARGEEEEEEDQGEFA